MRWRQVGSKLAAGRRESLVCLFCSSATQQRVFVTGQQRALPLPAARGGMGLLLFLGARDGGEGRADAVAAVRRGGEPGEALESGN